MLLVKTAAILVKMVEVQNCAGNLQDFFFLISSLRLNKPHMTQKRTIKGNMTSDLTKVTAQLLQVATEFL